MGRAWGLRVCILTKLPGVADVAVSWDPGDFGSDVPVATRVNTYVEHTS